MCSGAARPVADLERVGGQGADGARHVLDRGDDDVHDLADGPCDCFDGFLDDIFANLVLAESILHADKCRGVGRLRAWPVFRSG